MKKFGSWGYKIDYDKEIVIDEAQIAKLQDEVVVRIGEDMDDTESQLQNAVLAILYAPNRQSRWHRGFVAGINEVEIALLAAYEDTPHADEFLSEAGLSKLPEGWYKRGREIYERLEAIEVFPTPLRLRYLKAAKASLARHRRNKEKHGKSLT